MENKHSSGPTVPEQGDPIEIRVAKPADNPSLAHIIRQVMTEFGLNRQGTGFDSPDLDMISQAYNKAGSTFLSVIQNGQVAGGAGLAPLNGAKATCELQRMYFLPSLRDKGIGRRLLAELLKRAEHMGYQRCYLETMEGMDKARKLYASFGFVRRTEPLGASGHCGCNAWYEKKLQNV